MLQDSSGALFWVRPEVIGQFPLFRSNFTITVRSSSASIPSIPLTSQQLHAWSPFQCLFRRPYQTCFRDEEQGSLGQMVVRHIYISFAISFTQVNRDCTIGREVRFPQSNLVSCSISKTRKEGGEFASNCRICVIFEDDSIEYWGRCDLYVQLDVDRFSYDGMICLSLVAHQALRNCIYLEKEWASSSDVW